MTDLTAEDILHADKDRKIGLAAINDMAKAMLERGITPEELGRVSRMKMWQTVTKNTDNEPEVTDLYGFHLAPSWDNGPEWPVIDRAPEGSFQAPKIIKVKADSKWKKAVILPDIQAGYFRAADDGPLEPIHDEAAIAIALAIIQDVNPELIVLLGDNLDLPEFGKYRQYPAFQRTTQKAVDWMGSFVAELRRMCPDAEIVWLAGNHEERLPNYIVDNAKSAFLIKRANTPEGWPVMSVPHLCRLDDYGVNYVPGYPAGNYWVNQNLRIVHGYKVKSNNMTAYGYLDSEKVSVIYGHVHRREWAERTRMDFDGPANVMAASPGCLARLDGAVPGVHTGYDLDGRPMRIQENWQQGLAVVRFTDSRFSYQQVAIHQDGNNRWADYRDQVYEASR